MSIYGLLIGIAFAIGAQYFSQKNKIIPKSKETVFIFLLFLFSLLGARTYYVISSWPYYSQNLNQIINTRGGGMAILGGLIGGILFIFIFSKLNKLSFLKILNIIAPIVPLGQSIGRFGNYFNHEIYSLNNKPIWLYESILNLILFFILIKIKKHQTATYLIGYGTIRFLTEFIRWDTFVINNIKIGQIISLIFILIGIILILKKKTSNKVL